MFIKIDEMIYFPLYNKSTFHFCRNYRWKGNDNKRIHCKCYLQRYVFII